LKRPSTPAFGKWIDQPRDPPSQAIYTARGVGTANSVDVDFAPLGRVDLEVVPTGKEETLSSKCGGKGKKTTVPASELVGTFEFHGEEGFTEFSATHLPLRLDALVNMICGTPSSVLTVGGSHVGGVLLSAKTAESPSLVVQQSHRGGRVFYEAKMHEKERTRRTPPTRRQPNCAPARVPGSDR